MFCKMPPGETLEKDGYNEVGATKKDVDDVVDKMKAGGKAIAEKLLNPERGSEHEYVNEKEEENASSSATGVQMTSKEIVNLFTPQYKKILVPHDGSESSDKALAHAIYLSKISKAEIIILNAIEDVHEIAPTTISAGSEPEQNASIAHAKMEDQQASAKDEIRTTPSSNEDLNFKIKGRLENMIKERISLCRDAGVESQISYRIQTGKALDQIVDLAKNSDVDLIIMVSDKIGSSIKGIMSSTRKVIDAVDTPVLVLNG
jgi:nucleotide-binding universal stress UspA family protein